MATWVLPADTPLSTMLPSGGGSLASGDTIDFNGHTLVMDCDAVNYPFTPTNTGGVHCKLELRDLSRIKLNASLPSTVHPWVDPEHPLPVSAEPGIDGDPYRTPLTANARAEIQIGAFSLGGGVANLPTETRDGAFWAIVTGSDSTTTLLFDRDFPLHAGDYIFNISNYDPLQKVQVAAYDATTRTATLAASPSRRTVGDTWILLAGGICLNKVNTTASTVTWFDRAVHCGTVILFSNTTASNNGIVFGSAVAADRVLWGGSGGLGVGSNPIIGTTSFAKIRQLACGRFLPGSAFLAKSNVGEIVCFAYFMDSNNQKYYGKHVVSKARILQSYSFGGSSAVEILGGGIPILTPVDNASLHLVDCVIGGTLVRADFWTLTTGTVTRTARTDFPTDTDLPDAQYHAPKASDAVTFRYEDRWVRKGETLRLRSRWMPAAAWSKASVAVTELATWWPDLWPLGADALASAEFPPGLEQLRWHDCSVEWRNDTGEDCQVRVWECVTGDTLGGYLRVWQATGGAM